MGLTEPDRRACMRAARVGGCEECSHSARSGGAEIVITRERAAARTICRYSFPHVRTKRLNPAALLCAAGTRPCQAASRAASSRSAPLLTLQTPPRLTQQGNRPPQPPQSASSPSNRSAPSRTSPSPSQRASASRASCRARRLDVAEVKVGSTARSQTLPPAPRAARCACRRECARSAPRRRSRAAGRHYGCARTGSQGKLSLLP